jgi:hypothetical protein
MTMGLTPRQETQRKLWELVYAHPSGDDMWPIMLNEFSTDGARGVAHEVPQLLAELLVAAGLNDDGQVLDYCKAKLAELAGGSDPSANRLDALTDDLRRAAEGLREPTHWPDEDEEN